MPLLPAFRILDDCNRPQSDAALFPAHGFRFPCQTAVVKVRLLGFSGFTLMYCRNNGRLAPRVRTCAWLPLCGCLMHCANILSGETAPALLTKLLSDLFVFLCFACATGCCHVECPWASLLQPAFRTLRTTAIGRNQMQLSSPRTAFVFRAEPPSPRCAYLVSLV